MCPKVGRPRVEDPRNKKIEVRLNAQEAAQLDYCHKALGKPRAEILRACMRQTYLRLQREERSGRSTRR